MLGIGRLFIFSISPDVELTVLTKGLLVIKMQLKEKYPIKGCLNMEVDSQKRSDYLLLIQARLCGRINGFSQLVAIARKAGVSAKI